MTREDSDFAMAFEKIFFHLKFIDKNLEGSAKDQNPVIKEAKQKPKKDSKKVSN